MGLKGDKENEEKEYLLDHQVEVWYILKLSLDIYEVASNAYRLHKNQRAMLFNGSLSRLNNLEVNTQKLNLFFRVYKMTIDLIIQPHKNPKNYFKIYVAQFFKVNICYCIVQNNNI